MKKNIICINGKILATFKIIISIHSLECCIIEIIFVRYNNMMGKDRFIMRIIRLVIMAFITDEKLL